MPVGLPVHAERVIANWWQTTATCGSLQTHPVTAPKPTTKKAVDRVFYSLAEALRPELRIENVGDPDKVPSAEELFAAPPPPRLAPKGRVLWDAFQRAGAARARFTRRERFQGATRRGSDVAALDDKHKDLAMLRLRDAARLVGEAAQALRDDIQAVENMNERYGGVFPLEKEALANAAEAERLEKALNVLTERLNLFRGVPQIRTQREWDRFLSETAAAMLEVGFEPRTVAAVLTGTPEQKVTTDALERFRQRVRRLKETVT